MNRYLMFWQWLSRQDEHHCNFIGRDSDEEYAAYQRALTRPISANRLLTMRMNKHPF
jgi:hypothetical protein